MKRTIVPLCLLLLASIGAIAATDSTGEEVRSPRERALASAHAMADWLGADSYMLVSKGATVLYGVLIDLNTGTVLFPGDTFPATGTFWTYPGIETVVDINCGPVDFGMESVVMAVAEGGVSVECGAGWYACCYCQNGCPVARCRQNGTAEPPGGCQGGGPGSTACSISRSQCP